MDKNVYIVHNSAIVQKGLAHILQAEFNCKIKSFSDFKFISQYDINNYANSIFFVEYEIMKSTEFTQFIEAKNSILFFGVAINNFENISSHNTILLNFTTDKIIEKVKDAFTQKQQLDTESEELTKREIDVLKLVAIGFSNKEISDKLFISVYTVMSHRKNITEKLGIKSISGLTVYAIINNYIDTSNISLKELI